MGDILWVGVYVPKLVQGLNFGQQMELGATTLHTEAD